MTPTALPDRRRLRTPGIAAIAAFVAAIGVLVHAAWRVAEAAIIASPEAAAPGDDAPTPDMDSYLAQIDGRSVFFVPARPDPPPPKIEPPPVVVEKDPPKPSPVPPPSRYGGPAIIGVVSGTVWFDNGSKVAVGEGDESGDLRVMSIDDAPWAVRLEWKEVEFDVPLWSRDEVVIKPPPKRSEEARGSAVPGVPGGS